MTNSIKVTQVLTRCYHRIDWCPHINKFRDNTVSTPVVEEF